MLWKQKNTPKVKKARKLREPNRTAVKTKKSRLIETRAPSRISPRSLARPRRSIKTQSRSRARHPRACAIPQGARKPRTRAASAADVIFPARRALVVFFAANAECTAPHRHRASLASARARPRIHRSRGLHGTHVCYSWFPPIKVYIRAPRGSRRQRRRRRRRRRSAEETAVPALFLSARAKSSRARAPLFIGLKAAPRRRNPASERGSLARGPSGDSGFSDGFADKPSSRKIEASEGRARPRPSELVIGSAPQQ